MKVYFITRFSIYDPHFAGFRLIRYYSQREYERRLFDKRRLDSKFYAFENVTLSSIVGQSLPDWKWLIYTSDRLPDDYMKRLLTLVTSHPNIEVVTVKDFPDFFRKVSFGNYDRPFATVRLDDDDGLNSCFVKKLQQYSSCVGSIVSFTEGRRFKYCSGRLGMGDNFSMKNNAQGMAGIGLQIYNCGSHSDVNMRHKVIYDTTPDMFLLGCSPFADTARGFTLLGRVFGKIKRLGFLLFTRPSELPRECPAPFRKLSRPPEFQMRKRINLPIIEFYRNVV